MAKLAKTTAIANPTKAFFVRMITRDISLEDCILDLLDNSLDGAWRHTGSQPMTLGGGPNLTGYEVDIVANAGIFSITDNCGGMTLEDAAEHAFSFGRGSQDIHDDFSIGVYGIGMKRAVFKLGREILIRSTVIDDDGETLSFSVPIDVPAWLRKNDLPWDFDILEYDPLAKPGVAVEIENLTAAAREAFRNPAFIINLRRMLARDYSLHLARGLRVSLNGEPIVGITFELRVSDAFIPMRFSYPEETEGDVVIVEIIGGMAAAPPDSIDPSENEDGDRRMGWYVVCNGRIVLAADKTIISGWGSELWPQWHQQYSGFVGIIFFNAPKAIALPLTTTKRSVDVSSEVWRRARPKMREVTKAWITYTNQRKQAPEEARQLEAKARPVAIDKVVARPMVALPRLTSKQSEKVGNINFSMPVKRLRALAKGFDDINMSYREVGIRAFDYSYEDLVGDD